MKTFIFDLDGTLLNTLEDISSACNQMLQNHAWAPHDISAYRFMVGDGFTRLVQRSLPAGLGENLSQNELQDLTREAQGIYAKRMTDKTRLYDGVAEMLTGLTESGAALGILSNKPDGLVRELVKYYFPKTNFLFAHGAVPEFPHKPDPAFLLHLLNKCANPKEVYYVGDSKVDVRLARNANIPSVGAAWGFRGRGELEAEKADFIINKPEELLNI